MMGKENFIMSASIGSSESVGFLESSCMAVLYAPEPEGLMASYGGYGGFGTTASGTSVSTSTGSLGGMPSGIASGLGALGGSDSGGSNGGSSGGSTGGSSGGGSTGSAAGGSSSGSSGGGSGGTSVNTSTGSLGGMPPGIAGQLGLTDNGVGETAKGTTVSTDSGSLGGMPSGIASALGALTGFPGIGKARTTTPISYSTPAYGTHVSTSTGSLGGMPSSIANGLGALTKGDDKGDQGQIYSIPTDQFNMINLRAKIARTETKTSVPGSIYAAMARDANKGKDHSMWSKHSNKKSRNGMPSDVADNYNVYQMQDHPIDGYNLYSPVDGVVESIKWNDPNDHNNYCGFMVQVKGKDGNLYTYGHMDPNSVGDINVGDSVGKNQFVGRIGDPTNGISTGPHVHFQAQKKGESNPHNPGNYNPTRGKSKISAKFGKYTSGKLKGQNHWGIDYISN